MGKLTVRAVEAKTKAGVYYDGNGLALQVGPGGGKSWCFYYTHGKTKTGKPKVVEMGLGPIDLVTLAEARDLVHGYRQMLLRGLNPREQRDAARKRSEPPPTFATAVDQYVARKEHGWKNPKTAKAFRSSLKRLAYPVIGNMRVNTITTGDVVKVLEPIWPRTPVMAAHLQSQISMVLKSAVAKGEAATNAADWQILKDLLPDAVRVRAPVHHPALPYREIPGLMAQLRTLGGTAPLALRLCILTAARTSETIKATWAEIDLDAKLWTVPASRMKSRRDHRVPLSKPALALLAALPRVHGDDHLFPGYRRGVGLSNMAMLKLLRELRRGMTVHGTARASFRSWCQEEQPDVPDEVAEAVLAHVVGSRTRRAYARSDLLDLRRTLMAEWGHFCAP